MRNTSVCARSRVCPRGYYFFVFYENRTYNKSGVERLNEIARVFERPRITEVTAAAVSHVVYHRARYFIF